MLSIHDSTGFSIVASPCRQDIHLDRCCSVIKLFHLFDELDFDTVIKDKHWYYQL